MGLVNTEAVVLRHYEFGEADKIIVLFTRRRGKLRAVANGVRKTKSSLAAGLEVFTYSKLLIYQGKSDLGRISQVEIKESFSQLKQDIVKLGTASYLGELIVELTTAEQGQPEVFKLLVLTLNLLNNFSELDLLLRSFELKLLTQLGFRPHLADCVHCGRELEGEVKFSLAAGGVVCKAHAESRDKPLTLGTVKFMQRLLQVNYQNLLQLDLADYANQELATILPAYIEYIIDKPLKSTSFLASIKEAPTD